MGTNTIIWISKESFEKMEGYEIIDLYYKFSGRWHDTIERRYDDMQLDNGTIHIKEILRKCVETSKIKDEDRELILRFSEYDIFFQMDCYDKFELKGYLDLAESIYESLNDFKLTHKSKGAKKK